MAQILLPIAYLLAIFSFAVWQLKIAKFIRLRNNAPHDFYRHKLAINADKIERHTDKY